MAKAIHPASPTLTCRIAERSGRSEICQLGGPDLLARRALNHLVLAFVELLHQIIVECTHRRRYSLSRYENSEEL